MTGPQERAIRLLAIQEARGGWATIGVLKSLRVTRQTLNALGRDRIVQFRDNGADKNEYHRTSYRLTTYGQRLAVEMRPKSNGL